MTKKHTFTATIQDAGEGGAFVEVPFDVEAAFGSKRPKIVATIDGVPYRGSLVRMGGDKHILIVLKKIREQIGKSFSDEVTVIIGADTEPRVVKVPDDLAAAFKTEAKAKAYFEKLSYTHQREYVNWIQDAKRDETRRRRIAKAIEMLTEGKKAG